MRSVMRRLTLMFQARRDDVTESEGEKIVTFG